MYKYTYDQFQALINLGVWTFETHVEHLASNEVSRRISEDANDIITQHHGCATITARCGDDISVTYEEGYSYDAFMPTTFKSSTEGLDQPWKVEGFTIIDENGDEDFDCIVVHELPAEFSEVRYQDEDLYEYDETNDIDEDNDMNASNYEVHPSADEQTFCVVNSKTGQVRNEALTEEDADKLVAELNMETTTLTVDNQPDIKFTGERVASASSYQHGDNDVRWTELDLYKTRGGKYICHQTGATRWHGESYRYRALVCESESEVIEFFGHGWLAKELYAEAEIDAVNEID